MQKHQILRRLQVVLLCREALMEGIRYMVDEQGRRVAVVIDLKRYGDLWEDFHDTLLAYERANEPRESLREVKERLQKLGKLDG